jgi:hypothetical protein
MACKKTAIGRPYILPSDIGKPALPHPGTIGRRNGRLRNKIVKTFYYSIKQRILRTLLYDSDFQKVVCVFCV